MSEAIEATATPEPIGYVYFIREVMKNGKGRIKIGYSLHGPDERFNAHNMSCSRDVEKFALMRATYSHEQALHKRFKKLRKRGEWFRSHASLLAYIAENAWGWKELLDEERGVDEVRWAAEREESNRRMREQYKRINAHQTYCHLLGLDPMETPMGEAECRYDEMRKRRNKPPKPRRFGPLQALLDKLAADKDPAP
jgi:hypothetical protein